jgi:hypothetical protein
MVVLVCCIASCGLFRVFEKYSYWGVLTFLLIICIILIIVFYPLLVSGHSIRHKNELIALLKYISHVKNDFFSLSNPYYYGMLLVLISFWGWCEGRIKSIFFFPIYTIGMILIPFTTSRSAICGMIGGILAIFLFAKPQKRLGFYLGVAIALLIGVFLFYNIADGYMIKRITSTVNEFTQANKEKVNNMARKLSNSNKISPSEKISNTHQISKPIIYGSRSAADLGSGRIRIWIDCINKILENPITGYGFSAYKHISIRQRADYSTSSERFYDRRMRVGNSIIDAFLSTGIWGGVLFLVILLRATIDAIICLRQHREHGWIASIFLALVCTQMVEGSVYIRHYWFLAVVLRAIVVLQINKNDIPANNKKLFNNNNVSIIVVIITGLLLTAICCFITKNSPFKNLFDIPNIKKVQIQAHTEKIWDKANHNAFTDLIKYKSDLYLAFREGNEHKVPLAPIGDQAGRIRILKSNDGTKWETFDLIEMSETDLRDPSFQITSNGQLQCIINGCFYSGGKLQTKPFVMFMDDKNNQFTKPQPVVFDSDVACTGKDVIWRGDWYDNMGYFVVYHWTDWDKFDWTADLIKTTDGISYSFVAKIIIPNDNPSEVSVHVDKQGTIHLLTRCDGKHKTAMYGKIKLPYNAELRETLYDTSIRMGGQDFIFLSERNLLICSRVYEYNIDSQVQNCYTALLKLDTSNGNAKEILRLPSGGDTSYAGLVLDNNILYIAYYSSHEQNKAAIYFTKIDLNNTKGLN